MSLFYDLGTVTLSGNIDVPDGGLVMRHTSNGTPVVNIRIARSMGNDPNNANQRREPEWYTIVVYGRLAHHAIQSLQRGERITVAGRLRQNNWIDPQGVQRSTVEIIADDIAKSIFWGPLPQRVPTRSQQAGMPTAQDLMLPPAAMSAPGPMNPAAPAQPQPVPGGTPELPF